MNKYYDPDSERTCCGCYKQLETKAGVLASNRFTCPDCHKWYKGYDIVTSIIIIVVITSPFIWVIWLVKKGTSSKERKEN